MSFANIRGFRSNFSTFRIGHSWHPILKIDKKTIYLNLQSFLLSSNGFGLTFGTFAFTPRNGVEIHFIDDCWFERSTQCVHRNQTSLNALKEVKLIQCCENFWRKTLGKRLTLLTWKALTTGMPKMQHSCCITELRIVSKDWVTGLRPIRRYTQTGAGCLKRHLKKGK